MLDLHWPFTCSEPGLDSIIAFHALGPHGSDSPPSLEHHCGGSSENLLLAQTVSPSPGAGLVSGSLSLSLSLPPSLSQSLLPGTTRSGIHTTLWRSHRHNCLGIGTDARAYLHKLLRSGDRRLGFFFLGGWWRRRKGGVGLGGWGGGQGQEDNKQKKVSPGPVNWKGIYC